MANIFWQGQPQSMQKEYIEFLKIVGSLSNLFSDSSDPYLYYRAHENLFCQVFNAKNLARGDISFDAIKDGMGIGLKTFINGNGKTFQKVAEFNSDSHLIRGLGSDEEIVQKIAELRNKRINLTQNVAGTNQSLYHMVTRERGKMNVIETTMDPVDINSIRLNNKQSRNTIKFKDKYNEYSFSLSKNTLLKRFDTSDSEIIMQFDVDILDNPFEFLTRNKILAQRTLQPVIEEEEYIILPLYSPRSKVVEEKSGLNQWNAGGRTRDIDEVYIPIPSWIHDTFGDFFVYSRKFKGKSAKDSPVFDVELPSGEVMSCKVAQQGGKALMSNPNKALGKWILRDVLKIKEGTLLKMEMLEEVGIDSVKLTKKNDGYYYLDFMESGSFELFEENNKS
ncbi:restriction endonuclease PLD domain-containing protein [Jeotgalibaca caeni]|uniref:restriction endonuclease PLD domain-containing protein n=1 Tax=Jeotgalibaca caeni TaxID=3028623 RepID=UPI00237D90FF|nr:restriction endonuclease PLD domain-containing protein [Jeotgalibaca caeni]MDE1549487.1 NgoFVII family restriction endonuclease [Jeotgalibaca caeni]